MPERPLYRHPEGTRDRSGPPLLDRLRMAYVDDLLRVGASRLSDSGESTSIIVPPAVMSNAFAALAAREGQLRRPCSLQAPSLARTPT